MDQFAIGGIQFQLSPLPYDEAKKIFRPVLRLLKPVLAVAGSFLPALAESAKTPVDAEAPDAEGAPPLDIAEVLRVLRDNIDEASDAADFIDPIVRVFRNYCGVKSQHYESRGGKKDGVKFLPLSADDFFDQTFSRKHARLLEWVVTCIAHEFGDFLDELGNGPSPSKPTDPG